MAALALALAACAAQTGGGDDGERQRKLERADIVEPVAGPATTSTDLNDTLLGTPPNRNPPNSNPPNSNPNASNPATGAPPAMPPRPTLSGAQRADCLATGGTVERAGRMGAERCTRPYGDAGEPCTASTQCEGACLADDGAPDASLPGAPPEGTCQRTDNPFGCRTRLENGERITLCVD